MDEALASGEDAVLAYFELQVVVSLLGMLWPSQSP